MKYQYWLSNIEGIGSASIQKMMNYVSSAEELYFLPEEQLEQMEQVGKEARQKIIDSRRTWDLDAAWENFQKRGISFVSQEMESYPEKLRNIYNPPYSIYFRGDLPDGHRRTIAIVGARRCSEYGRSMAEKLGERLAEYHIPVISGMAMGVDFYGHIGALKGKGKTYAVLGCGVDICYPALHKQLYRDIMDNGGIISEYPPGTAVKAQLFPARNRIISALSDIVVVVEAKKKSGSLITADFALEQGKDIFAFPGRATDELSNGCNALIRQGAGIITSVDSFLADLGIFDEKECHQESLFEEFPKIILEKEESMVYSCLDLRPRSLEEISYRTGIKVQYLISLIQGMIEKGVLKETFHNYYMRVNERSPSERQNV